MTEDSRKETHPSRRDFLKAGACGAAGFLLAPRSGAANGPALSGPAVAAASGKTADSTRSESPAWTKDLVIYEIAPKGFTSPRGPESGTFNSLASKLPYLQDFGINGVWLTGHSLALPRYFYNIWSQYANVEPDKIEPSLGTPDDFRSLVDAAHQRGIRIFLDVHVRGVHASSPLLARHPEWFRKWLADPSMVDYDWTGGHTDLDDWWVKIWTDCVTRYGVDGFRLDINIARPDLWARIRRNAADAGHEIVIFEEGDFPIPGVTDFPQGGNKIYAGVDGWNEALVQDVPGFYARKFGRAGTYHVAIRFADGSRAEGSSDGRGILRVRLDGLTTDEIGRRDPDHLDGLPDVQLTIENVGNKPVAEVVVTDDRSREWRYRSNLVIKGKSPTLTAHFATLGYGYPSVLLSCHDRGWEGFPPDKSPYVAQGSRAVFGYAVLFSAMIPVFFAGEEFDATFRPIPWESPHFLGAEGAGKGRWLYGCMLDWHELERPGHRSMLDDVKRMIAVRKREADILAAAPDREEPRLEAVRFESDIPVPVPYARWNERAAIVVAANRGTGRDARMTLTLPLKDIGLAGHAHYKITDLWPGGDVKPCVERDLANMVIKVKRDKTPGGGLRVFKVEPTG